MIGLKYRYTWGLMPETQTIGVMKALPARSIDQGIDYINAIFETRLRPACVARAVWCGK